MRNVRVAGSYCPGSSTCGSATGGLIPHFPVQACILNSRIENVRGDPEAGSREG